MPYSNPRRMLPSCCGCGVAEAAGPGRRPGPTWAPGSGDAEDRKPRERQSLLNRTARGGGLPQQELAAQRESYCPMLGGSKPSPLGDGFSSYSWQVAPDVNGPAADFRGRGRYRGRNRNRNRDRFCAWHEMPRAKAETDCDPDTDPDAREAKPSCAGKRNFAGFCPGQDLSPIQRSYRLEAVEYSPS